MFERFTDGAQRALGIAQEKSKEFGHDYVGTEHLLLGLLEEDSVASKALHSLGLEDEVTEKAVLDAVGRGNSHSNELYITPRTKRVLQLAVGIANQMQHNYVGAEHLLLGILQDGDGVAVNVLYSMGIRSNDVVKAINNIYGSEQGGAEGAGNGSGSANGSSNLGDLKDFATDLNEVAKQGKIDPVIGRDNEINRVIQILSRRTKNNPVLIGEPGVGKTAIAEGLAQRIVSQNVPEILRNKRIISLSLTAMVAGAKYRGEFEERLKKAIDEVQKHDDMIIFIDELHTLIGAGASEGSMDAANILKPALARGTFQVIGATTLDEYKKHIEKDAALERRFQPVLVGEPSEEEALEILKGLRDRYEAFHKAKITDEALKAAVELSSRYISDRFLPDKAIDVMDEAASKVRMKVFTAPPDVKDLETRLADVRKEKEAAVTGQNYEEAAKLRDEEKKLVDEIEAKQAARSKEDEEKLVVTEDDIAAVVSQWSGVPVAKIAEEESERLLRLEDELHERVVGQDEAVVAVSKAVRRKPYSVILFDEVEKAHPDFFNILLQVLDDGRLTDNQGRTVDFRNTVIIMTSNLGSNFLKEDSAAMGFLAAKSKDDAKKNAESNFAEAKKNTLDAVKRHFRPEFLNRIDEMVVFHPLTGEDLGKIVNILLKDVTKRLAERDLALEVSPEALEVLVKEGSDFAYGARPLKRAIQRLVEDPISDLILKGDAPAGSVIKANVVDGDITMVV